MEWMSWTARPATAVAARVAGRVTFSASKGIVEVLAVAHHRRRPAYWHRRVAKE